MRYVLGLLMAAGILLGQVSDANAQLRFGRRNAGARMMYNQQPVYGQPGMVYAQPYPPGNVPYNYNAGYMGTMPNPGMSYPVQTYQTPFYGSQPTYVAPPTYGTQPAYGTSPNVTFGGNGMTVTGPGGVSATVPSQPR